jgi:hemerythrin-like metal-binding protein
MQSYLPTAAMLDDSSLDAIHGLLFEILGKTLQLPKDQFPAAYGEVVKGIEMDFRREDQLMEDFRCPDAREHREQHARVLTGLHHAGSMLAQGDDMPAHRALAALADWLPLHIATQDRDLDRTLRVRKAKTPQFTR